MRPANPILESPDLPVIDHVNDHVNGRVTKWSADTRLVVGSLQDSHQDENAAKNHQDSVGHFSALQFVHHGLDFKFSIELSLAHRLRAYLNHDSNLSGRSN